MTKLKTPVTMVMNMKGGVGKTTVSTHLAWSLAWHYDARVLLIDYDPQCSASLAVLDAKKYFSLKDDQKTLASHLLPNTKPKDPFNKISIVNDQELNLANFTTQIRNWVYKNVIPEKPAGCFDLIAGDLDLMRLALSTISEEIEEKIMKRWTNLLEKAKSEYDFIIVDCHPAGSFFTKSTLLSSDYILIPANSDNYSAQGLGLMRNFIDSWKSGDTMPFGIIFNGTQSRWDLDLENTIRLNPRFLKNCFSGKIPHSSLIANAAVTKKFAAETKKPNRNKVSISVGRLAEEFIGKLVSHGLIESGKWKRLR